VRGQGIGVKRGSGRREKAEPKKTNLALAEDIRALGENSCLLADQFATFSYHSPDKKTIGLEERGR